MVSPAFNGGDFMNLFMLLMSGVFFSFVTQCAFADDYRSTLYETDSGEKLSHLRPNLPLQVEDSCVALTLHEEPDKSAGNKPIGVALCEANSNGKCPTLNRCSDLTRPDDIELFSTENSDRGKDKDAIAVRRKKQIYTVNKVRYIYSFKFFPVKPGFFEI
jgi:hypothetical protein